MCIMPLLHAARSTIGGGLKVTLGRSGTVPSGEAILRISARTTKRASLPLLVCGVARTRDARRSASGAASAVLKPIIAATCAAMFLMFDRPFRQPRFDTTAATKESDEPSRPRAGGASNFASQPRFLGFFRRIRFSRFSNGAFTRDTAVYNFRGHDTPIGRIGFEG